MERPPSPSPSLGACSSGYLEHPCELCKASRVKCNRTWPCDRCARLGCECVPQSRGKRGRPRSTKHTTHHSCHQPEYSDRKRPLLEVSHDAMGRMNHHSQLSPTSSPLPSPSYRGNTIYQPLPPWDSPANTATTTATRPTSAPAFPDANESMPFYSPPSDKELLALKGTTSCELAGSIMCSMLPRLKAEDKIDAFSASRMM